MISTNNKIHNKNSASTGSLAGSKRVLFLHSICLARARTNKPAANLLHQSRHVEIDAAGSRPGFRQNKPKACRKHVANPHELVGNLAASKPGCKPGFRPGLHCKPARKPGLQPGLQLARIMECGLTLTRDKNYCEYCNYVAFGIAYRRVNTTGLYLKKSSHLRFIHLKTIL